MNKDEDILIELRSINSNIIKLIDLISNQRSGSDFRPNDRVPRTAAETIGAEVKTRIAEARRKAQDQFNVFGQPNVPSGPHNYGD